MPHRVHATSEPWVLRSTAVPAMVGRVGGGDLSILTATAPCRGGVLTPGPPRSSATIPTSSLPIPPAPTTAPHPFTPAHRHHGRYHNRLEQRLGQRPGKADFKEPKVVEIVQILEHAQPVVQDQREDPVGADEDDQADQQGRGDDHGLDGDFAGWGRGCGLWGTAWRRPRRGQRVRWRGDDEIVLVVVEDAVVKVAVVGGVVVVVDIPGGVAVVGVMVRSVGVGGSGLVVAAGVERDGGAVEVGSVVGVVASVDGGQDPVGVDFHGEQGAHEQQTQHRRNDE